MATLPVSARLRTSAAQASVNLGASPSPNKGWRLGGARWPGVNVAHAQKRVVNPQRTMLPDKHGTPRSRSIARVVAGHLSRRHGSGAAQAAQWNDSSTVPLRAVDACHCQIDRWVPHRGMAAAHELGALHSERWIGEIEPQPKSPRSRKRGPNGRPARAHASASAERR